MYNKKFDGALKALCIEYDYISYRLSSVLYAFKKFADVETLEEVENIIKKYT